MKRRITAWAVAVVMLLVSFSYSPAEVFADGPAQEKEEPIGYCQYCDQEMTFTHVAYRAATCGESGQREHWKCDKCGCLYEDPWGEDEINALETVIPKLAYHTWTSKVTEAATENNTGIRTYTCTVCHKQKTEVIPKVLPAITIATKVSLFKAKAEENGKVTLIWSKLANKKSDKKIYKKISKIEIQYSQDKTFETGVISKILGKKNSKYAFRLKKNTVYYFRIRYIDRKGGCSSWVSTEVKTKK